MKALYPLFETFILLGLLEASPQPHMGWHLPKKSLVTTLENRLFL